MSTGDLLASVHSANRAVTNGLLVAGPYSPAGYSPRVGREGDNPDAFTRHDADALSEILTDVFAQGA